MPIAAVVGPNHWSYTLQYSDLIVAGSAVGTKAAVTLHKILPPGWEVKDVEVETVTAFNGAGTRALNVGVTGALTSIINALDVKAAAYKTPTVTKYRATASIAVTAQLVTATDDPTAGEVRITLVLIKVRKEA